jgi:rhamnogalacturonan acetylesterase
MVKTTALVWMFVFVLLATVVSGQTRPLENPASPAAPPEDGKPTLWLVGDSTVRNGTHGEKGWGEVIGKLFDQKRIHVSNHAAGGRSSRTFITDGRWDTILAQCKAGDFVLIQLGHNDAGAINDNSRARGTIRGVGEETVEIDNQLTGKHEIVHTYGWYMRKYVRDAVEKKMMPIVCSPVPHVPKALVKAGELEKSDYVKFSEEVAEQEKVPFIQLNGLIMAKYAGMDGGQIKSRYFTSADNTHTNPVGAELNAGCVVEGIRATKGCEELARYLLDPAATQPVK